MELCCKAKFQGHINIDFEQLDKKHVGVILGVVNTGDSSTEQGTTSKNLILKRMNNAMSAWIGMRYIIKISNPSKCPVLTSEQKYQRFCVETISELFCPFVIISSFLFIIIASVYISQIFSIFRFRIYFI